MRHFFKCFIFLAVIDEKEVPAHLLAALCLRLPVCHHPDSKTASQPDSQTGSQAVRQAGRKEGRKADR